MKLPKLYLNGMHTNSGLWRAPSSSVRFVIFGGTRTWQSSMPASVDMGSE